MSPSEDARALAQRLLQVGTAVVHPAITRLEQPFELERLRIAIGFIARARLVEHRHRLVRESRGGDRLAGLPGDGGEAGEGP